MLEGRKFGVAITGGYLKMLCTFVNRGAFVREGCYTLM